MIDGQNESDIAGYIGNSEQYHPCFARPFNSTAIVQINFDGYIDSNQWIPAICYNQSNNETYLNEYIFDGAASLTLNNIIFCNQNLTTYGLVRSVQIDCMNCKFMKITQSVGPLFYTGSTIYLESNLFSDIQLITNFIYVDGTDYGKTRELLINNSIFTNLLSSQSFFHMSYSLSDVKYYIFAL